MKTLILPGYSIRNKKWAGEIAANLAEAEVNPWVHWESGGTMNAREELGAILKRIGKDRVHLLAKSVGCRMAARVIVQIPEQIGKVIFCGIPSTTDEARADYAVALEALPAERVLVIQNKNDPLASFAEVQPMIHAINPALRVLERPRNDHSYPYPGDFRAFLKEKA